MSHDPNFAITLSEEPLMLGAIAGAVVVVLALVVLTIVRKSRAGNRRVAAWRAAAEELGIQFAPNGSDLGPVVRGRVNDHVVAIAPLAGPKKGSRRARTLYTVKYEAPEAPKFRLTRRTKSSGPVVDTGNRQFDEMVWIETDHPALLGRFLTGPRRAAILRLLNLWPSAEISNRTAHLKTTGIEADQAALVDAICHLVASAETFDRPTFAPEPTPIAVLEDAPSSSASAITSVAPRTKAAQPAGGLMVEVRLDEQSVIRELFDSGLVGTEIVERFQQYYRGHEVTWTGEVVRASALEGAGVQRIAVLIGSADGQNPSSGRVVAITTVGAEPVLAPGDVATFTGSLVNLDAEQRLLHLV